MEFELNYTLEELQDRTSKEKFTEILLIDENNENYKSLSNNEKMVLCHLVRASKWLDVIHFKMENCHNEEFSKYLDEEIRKNNEIALLTKQLFLAQKSIFSPDAEGNKIKLVKNLEEPIAMNFYPENLTYEEFHKILNDMLDNGKIEEVQKILSQRTIVKRNNNELVGIDYIEEFEEFKEVAKELRNAVRYCEDKDFAEFLVLQASALEKVDNNLDALADKKWATLNKSKFEFTITRETYNDRMTESIFANEELNKKIENLNIEINTKDNIGGRVGIVDKQGTKLLYELENLTSIAQKYMPFKEEYSQEKKKDEISQMAVDVDIIYLSGDTGAYQAGITLAENLPNNDKLSLKIGGGRKNVYHRQIRLSKDNNKVTEAMITPNQLKYHFLEASHWATICHENTHSLGPDGNKVLGKYSSIIEEFKADMGMYAFLDKFIDSGIFTEEQAKQIIVTELSMCFPKGKPTLEQAHRVRSVMIANRMMEDNAITFDNENKLVFNFEKVIETSKIMMEEVVRLQLDKNVQKAEDYVNKYFVWNDKFQLMEQIQKKFSKKLNSYVTSPLADKMLNSNFKP